MYCLNFNTYGDFEAVKSAMEACRVDSCCQAVFDKGCNKKEKVMLCGQEQSPIVTGADNCVYKKSNYKHGI